MWGVMDLPKDLDIKKLEAQLARIKSLGYDGIEASRLIRRAAASAARDRRR